MSGDELIETLRNIRFPGVEKLDSGSFDWIFEDPDLLPFLDWFCLNISEGNLLSQDEIQKYKELEQSSGVLEGKQLVEAMQALSLMDDQQPEEVIREEVAQLEEDLKFTLHRKNILIQQRNKLSLQHAALADRESQLESLEKAEKSAYKKELEHSNAVNSKMNQALEVLMEAVVKLTKLYEGISEVRKLKSQTGPESEVIYLLSQVDMQAFHSMEEKFSVELKNFTRKQFFEGIADIASEGATTRYEFLEVSNPAALLVRGEKQDINLEECKDLSRLQAIYPKGESQRINAHVEEKSTEAACLYMEDKLKTLKREPFPKDVRYMGELVNDAEQKHRSIANDLAQLAENQVPSLIRDSAELQVSKILRGDYNLKIARQDYFTSNQDQLIYHLITQRSRSEFLTMAFELEMKSHRDTHQLLTAVSMLLKNYVQSQDSRMKIMNENLKSCTKHQRGTIDSRDKFVTSLHNMLGNDDKKGQLFLTYNSLVEQAEALDQRVTDLEKALASTCSSQDDRLALLENNLKSCEDMVYKGSATRGGQPALCPPSILDARTQLINMLDKVEHTVLDTIKDVEKKRKALKNDPLAATQRELFVYFYNDHDRLRRAVEDVENRLQAKMVT